MMTRLALAAALSLATLPAYADAPVIGAPAPAFTGTGSDGASISLSDFAGQPVVLEWSNDGCPFVKRHYNAGNMQAVQQAAADKGAAWLTIISSAPGEQGHVTGAQADALTAERGAHPTAVVLDPEGTIGHLYRATNTPHMFVIAADGTLAYMGAIDDSPRGGADAHNYVLAALDDLGAGRPVAEPITRAYGCNVKYAY